VAAVLMAALAVGAIFVANASNRNQPTGGLPVVATPSPSPAASPAPSPSADPTPVPTPAATPSPAAISFTCGKSSAFSGKQPPLSAFIDAVRTGKHIGYDRVTIEFQNGQPQIINLQPQAGTSFTRDGKGDTVKLAGKDGLLIRVFNSDSHTAFIGPTDIKTGFAGLLEVRLVGDYEGYVHWALGLAKPACYRAFILDNPTRLVVDIQTA
jgi:hypothetical protein